MGYLLINIKCLCVHIFFPLIISLSFTYLIDMTHLYANNLCGNSILEQNEECDNDNGQQSICDQCQLGFSISNIIKFNSKHLLTRETARESNLHFENKVC